MNPQANALRQAGFAALKAGRLAEAVGSFQQAAGLEPDSYDTFAYLGAAYARQGNFESARRAFGRAVQLQPASAKARFNLGNAHQMAGDTEAARVCFQTAVEFDPGYTQAQEALAKIPPKVVSMSDLASPGAMHMPGAQASSLGDEAPAEPAHVMTPEEIARLASPQGHLHMMGAQAVEDK